ncbi:secreted antigen 1 [Babesia caballi]|uniref:Secreted antigen 1 n=1 Tax=Babesia caballi TaxID=5871 RepID=A0AAV4LLE4_BABCB|nr:secreted antigen 1 [Babesia caballi]
MTAESSSINQPTTLKASLEFLSKLHSLGAAATVGEALEDKVKEAVNKLGGNEVNSENFLTNKITSNLAKVLNKSSELRNEILLTPESTYENYQDLDGKQRATECADILLDLLPKLHSTVYYLYFQVSGSFRNSGGAQWETQTCKERFNEDTYLHKWLVNTKGLPSWKNSNDTLLPCGFNSAELSDKYGHELHSVLLGFVDDEEDLAYLPKLLYDLVFATQLTTAGSATALVVTAAFCTAVSEKEFSEETVESRCTSLTDVCSSVVATLNRIVPRTVTASNLMTCEGAVNYFIRILQSGGFGACIGWLKDNLQGIIQNLQKMGTTCQNWDKNMLEYGEYAGPFPYGFMFGTAWKGSTITARRRLFEIIENLTKSSPSTGSLCTLLQCIKNDRQVIVEQPQQKTPAVSGALPGSVEASGITAGTNGHVSVASTTAQFQISHSDAGENGVIDASNARGGTTRAVGYQGPFSDTGTTGQQGEATTTLTPRGQEAAETHSSGIFSGHMEGTHHSDSESQRQPTLTHPGSSGGVSRSSHGSSVTAGDNSTITIGSATGGVALLGGGGAALYFLNVGGIKTLITGAQ